MTIDITRILAEFAVNTRYEDIPPAVRAQAKIAMTDALGTMLAGQKDPGVRLLRKQALEDFRDGPASAFACERKLSPPGAALVNAAAAHALDYDSISVLIGFVASPTLFSLLAAAEEKGGVSGREMLTAFVVGWEVEAAIARGLGERGVYHYAKGWHSTATLAHFGAVIGAGKLLGLDVMQTRYAIGIAASEASGLRTMSGNMLNAFHVGKAARNGVVAARLAAQGFTAHPNVMETNWGFCNAFNGPGKYDLTEMADHLGDPYDFIDPGVWIKAYPCCGLVHSALDGVIDVSREHGLQPAQVKHIRIAVHALVPPTMHVDIPQTAYEGKFSTPFCVATALRNGAVKLKDFSEETIRDGELLDICGRVEMVVHPELRGYDTFLPPKEFTDLTFTLDDGRIIEHRVWRGNMRGMRLRPLSRDELKQKFLECAGDYCEAAYAENSFDILDDLEEIEDIREITSRFV